MNLGLKAKAGLYKLSLLEYHMSSTFKPFISSNILYRRNVTINHFDVNNADCF